MSDNNTTILRPDVLRAELEAIGVSTRIPLKVVAAESGVAYQRLWEFHRGLTRTMHVHNLTKLTDWLRQYKERGAQR